MSRQNYWKKKHEIICSGRRAMWLARLQNVFVEQIPLFGAGGHFGPA
jgi:hypothetical protein